LNKTVFQPILVFILVLLAITGILLSYSNFFPTKTTKQCNLDLTQECNVDDGEQKLTVKFLQTIEVEEELSLVINAPMGTKISAMWVQGINMYMGKNAVLVDTVYVESDKSVYTARLFLGSCSEPAMKWQLVVKTTHKDSEEKAWFFNFSTDRSKKAENR
jgi:hypothetical protein